MSVDPFGTAELVAATVATWVRSPDRFREDANAEEALSRGYRGRVLLELAANAVDAAAAAGVPAHLRIRVVNTPAGRELRVANTGAPLTADGVRGLSSLRASAKRDRLTVGHFGVGFTAVRELTDNPRLVTEMGGVEFSTTRTSEYVAAQGVRALTAELQARAGVVPALRLCWPIDDNDVPPGFATEVRLPLRDPGAADELLQQWRRSTVDELFWALPLLQQVDFESRTFSRTDDGSRTEITDGTTVLGFTQVSRSGLLAPELLADLPVEQQSRSQWWVRWVLPDAGAEPRPGWETVCAPIPTQVRLTLPARLIATLEVDDTRRHPEPGPLTDFVLDQAVAAYLDLVAAVPPHRRLNLVPGNGFPAGKLDADLRQTMVHRWQELPLLVTALGDAVRPADAVAVRGVDSATVRLLAQAIPGLLPPGDGQAAVAERTLGVKEVSIGQVVQALSEISRPPQWWRQVYTGLAEFDGEQLAGLPVPLVSGRQVLGARGLLLPATDTETLAERAAAALPSLRLVHPDAAHPLLARLGANDATADAMLQAPALLDEIARLATDIDQLEPEDLTESAVDRWAAQSASVGSAGSGDSRDSSYSEDASAAVPAQIAALVLELVAAGGSPGVEVAEVPLTAADGEPWPAGGLMLPGSPVRQLISELDVPTVHLQWLRRWDAQVLAAAGVRAGLLLIPLDDPRCDDLLPDLDEYLTEQPSVDPGSDLPEIAELDLIDDWAAGLSAIATDRQARAAAIAGGYTTWWLRKFVRIDGRTLGEYRTAAAIELAELFAPLPIQLDETVARALGVLTGFQDAADQHPQVLLERFCDPAVRVSAAHVPALTALVAAAVAGRAEVELPPTIRTLSGQVRAADEVAVPDGPWWAQVRGPDELVAPGSNPVATAKEFDLDLASIRWPGKLVIDADRPDSRSPSELADGPPVIALVVGRICQALGAGDQQPTIAIARSLQVHLGEQSTSVGWWPTEAGVMVVAWANELAAKELASSDSVPVAVADALADAVAWAVGRWSGRGLARAAAIGLSDAELVRSAFD